MVQRVIAPPLRERSERQHARHESHRVIQRARREERTVRAVVHEDERPHEEARGGNASTSATSRDTR